MAKAVPQYYIFVKPYTVGGTTVHSGVSIKGEFEVTDIHVSQKGSEFLSNIPKEYLEPHTPQVFEKKFGKK